MSSTAPSPAFSIHHVFFILTGAAAAAAACLLISAHIPSSPGSGLQRSNAVRRRGRRRDSPPTTAASSLPSSMAAAALEISSFGVYDLLGVPVSLNPHNLVTALELQALAARAFPIARQEDVDAAIAGLYDVFLDRLLASLFPARLLSSTESEAVRTWLGHRIPAGEAAVTRAAARHAASLLSGQFNADSTAESVAATDPEASLRSDADTEMETETEAMDLDGQNLQRTLYHIAEYRAKQEGVIHRGITCNGCDEKPIRGIRWHCANCVDFDLCSHCEATNSHYKTHIFYKIPIPAPYLGLPKQEPLYPGKPHMMSASIHTPLKKRLVSETKMQTEEIEALWDQFSCLAGTEWVDDPSKIGWAIDRRAFNHAFVPRYNSFVTAPNLIYDRIFAYYDTDKNDLIGFDEWIKGIDGMHTNDVRVKAGIVFRGYDIDEDGYVSRKDILRLFRAFYAIEKEATRNYVAELTGDLSVRNALDAIRSSQPLGSAFSPHSMIASSAQYASGPHTKTHDNDDDDSVLPVLDEHDFDMASRDDILRATDVRSTMAGHMLQSEQDRIVLDRWARREFYVDQEEGLGRPEGVDDMEQADGASHDPKDQANGNNIALSGDERPRWSRSSSRVRFQDDVDADTRSNASASSRPMGERWGGYEIPEPERDLGKEVLYQITQQGFNELLDPLFQDKEDMAIDARATRIKRQEYVAAIKATIEEAESSRSETEAILQAGMFRFSKCMIDTFCKTLNDGVYHESFRSIFQSENGRGVERECAKSKLARIYASIEREIISSVQPSPAVKYDEMAFWNTILCRRQLQAETLDAVLNCVPHLGWTMAYPVAHGTEVDSQSFVPAATADHDPTLPQFRPDSMTGVDARQSREQPVLSADERVLETDECLRRGREEIIVYRDREGIERLASNPQGPFFALTVLEYKPPSVEEESDRASGKDGLTSPPSNDVLVVTAEASSTSEAPTSATATWPQSDAKEDQGYLSYTHEPVIHLISVDSSSDVAVLRSSPRPVNYSANPYQPEVDALKPLVRCIRQLAMATHSSLHFIMLASLEAAEQEIREREGSGLINLDEFAEHMSQGRLRFLESWMAWVSI